MMQILAGGASAGLAGCSAQEQNGAAPLPLPEAPPPASQRHLDPALRKTVVNPIAPLKSVFRNNFKIGAAAKSNQLGTDAGNLLWTHFDSVTPEYELKASIVSPTEGEFNFEGADRLIDEALARGVEVRGHSLLWHEETPQYFFDGSRAQIRQRLETYIGTVVNHFKDRIMVWDVVNEVINDDWNPDTAPYRNSRWFNAVGLEYIDWAFFAARSADANAKLFLNEYATEYPDKLARTMLVVQDLIDFGVPIDGVGHQFHLNLDVDPVNIRRAIQAVDALYAGLDVHVTELDISLYNDPGTCWERGRNCDADYGPVMPDNIDARQAALYEAIFDIFRSESSVTSVTSWGLYDGDSWLNSAPAQRYNHPLLFDRKMKPKTATRRMAEAAY